MAYEELDIDMKVSKDKNELTIKLKGKITIENVVAELEYLINQLARAEEERNRGAVEH